MSLANDSLDSVRELHDLDASVEEREQRRLIALVGGVLPGREADVGGRARQALTGHRLEAGEDRDPTNVVCRDHEKSIADLNKRERNGRKPIQPAGSSTLP